MPDYRKKYAKKIIPYQPKLKARARRLRKESSLAEILLWQEIKNRRLGFQFHRQVPIDNFIVDFYCHEVNLAIEIDGCSHYPEERQLYDKKQMRLESLGVRFIRFDDSEVKRDIPFVLSELMLLLNHYQDYNLKEYRPNRDEF